MREVNYDFQNSFNFFQKKKLSLSPWNEQFEIDEQRKVQALHYIIKAIYKKEQKSS